MRVAISIKQFEPAKIEADQIAIPIIKPRGPAFVRGPPMDTNSAAPIATRQHLSLIVSLVHTSRDGNKLDMSHTKTPIYQYQNRIMTMGLNSPMSIIR